MEEGEIQAGDAFELLSKHPDELSVADVTRLYTTERGNVALLKKAIAVTALPEKWGGFFEHQLSSLTPQERQVVVLTVSYLNECGPPIRPSPRWWGFRTARSRRSERANC